MWSTERMTIARVPSSSPYAARIGFSAAVRAGDLVFVAGMTALGPDGEVVGGNDPYAQAREALRKVEQAIVDAGGRGAADVVQTRVFLAHAGDWEEVGRAHGDVLGAAPPAAAMVVSRLLDPRMRVEIEAVASLSG